MASIGGDFTRAREARGLSIADVARQIHIKEIFLEAIESESWGIVGDVTSLGGLLRTYARFLGLDGQAIVGRFRQDVVPTLVEEPPPSPPSPKLDAKSIAAVVVGVLAIMVVFSSLTQFVARVRAHRVIAVSSPTAPASPMPAPSAGPTATVSPTATPSPTPSPAAPSPSPVATRSPEPQRTRSPERRPGPARR